MAAPAFAEDPRIVESRAIADRFQQTLKGALMAAIAEGGPTKAIEVCQVQAPAIAAQLGSETGAIVSRTSLKVRNPANAPTAAQRAVLEAFAARQQAGEEAGALEDFEPNAEGGPRYMRAIITQEPCLACHGREIAEPVRATLAERYPGDAATGYDLGEVRGAFSITWPTTGEGVP
jgi:hypothetical protein